MHPHLDTLESLNKDTVTQMMRVRGDCISLFMPTHRASAEIQQDRIRLKNLLEQARSQLRRRGVGTQEIERYLKPAEDLRLDRTFWQRQSDGLALFLSEAGMREFRLPRPFSELVIAADRYYLKPLLPLLVGDGRFYVLTLSQGDVRMYRGTRDRLAEMELEEMPDSLASAMRYDDPEASVNVHVAVPKRGGGNDAIYHGHTLNEVEGKKAILRFFQQLDKALNQVLASGSTPLILAGVDYLLPIYRQANSYPHLLDEGISQDPGALSLEELHTKAWEVVKPRFNQAQQAAWEQYQALAGSEKASDDLAQIVPASVHGRVDVLFVAIGARCWGAWDPDANQVTLHDEREDGDEDLLEVAAFETLSKGGTVYALSQETLPEQTVAAAVLRY